MIFFSRRQRFFRYHDHMYNTALQEKKRHSVIHAIPYWNVFKQCFPQCFNVFFTFFVTLTIFPAIHAGNKNHSNHLPTDSVVDSIRKNSLTRDLLFFQRFSKWTETFSFPNATFPLWHVSSRSMWLPSSETFCPPYLDGWVLARQDHLTLAKDFL